MPLSPSIAVDQFSVYFYISRVHAYLCCAYGPIWYQVACPLVGWWASAGSAVVGPSTETRYQLHRDQLRSAGHSGIPLWQLKNNTKWAYLELHLHIQATNLTQPATGTYRHCANWHSPVAADFLGYVNQVNVRHTSPGLNLYHTGYWRQESISI